MGEDGIYAVGSSPGRPISLGWEFEDAPSLGETTARFLFLDLVTLPAR